MGITNPSEAHFKGGLWGWDGSVWHKLPMLWGYSDRYAEAEKNEDTGSSGQLLTFSEVPPGEVWVVNSICWVNTESACSVIGVTIVEDGTSYTVHVENVPIADEYTLITPSLVMKAGDHLQVGFYSCVAHDKIYAWAAGYKMKVGE